MPRKKTKSISPKMKKPTWLTKKGREKFETVLGYMLYWKKDYEHESNKLLKPYTPMTMEQAAREVGMTSQNFVHYVNKYPELKEKYYELREQRREKIKVMAETRVDQAIEWKLDLTDKEMVDVSLKALQATDKAWNPKVEIEANVKRLNLNVSEEQLIDKINSLMWK